MTDTTSNNKRIAKNTLLLYGRMAFMMLISLYTSRVILKTLGVVDYGVYNVVGSIVSMFTVISNSLSAGVQRFLMVEVGKANEKSINKCFATSNTLFLIISGVFLLLAETVGLYLYSKLDIPTESLEGAMWVYQCSVLSLIVLFMSIPYNALIISYERFAFYGYVSIFEAALKLGVVFCLELWGNDSRLKVYAVLLLFAQIVTRSIYTWYSKRIVPFVKFQLNWNSRELASMTSFSTYKLSWEAAYTCATIGLNYLLNVFFGPVANAARGIAVQAQGAFYSFFKNFQSAVRPQITKNFSAGSYDYTQKLVFTSSKLIVFLLICMILPMMTGMSSVLKFWLGEYPPVTVPITCLILVECFLECATSPLEMVIEADGDIKKYQIIQSCILASVLPFVYLAYKMGYGLLSGFYILIILRIIVFALRIILICKKVAYSIIDYFKRVYLRIIPSLLSTIAITLFAIPEKNDSILNIIIVVCINFILQLVVAYAIVLESHERALVNKAIQIIRLKIKSR